MGKSPNRRRRLSPGQLVLYLRLTALGPTPTLDYGPLLCREDYCHPCCGDPRSDASRQPRPRPRPDHMAQGSRHRINLFPSRRPDHRLQVLGFFGNPDCRPDCLDVRFVP